MIALLALFLLWPTLVWGQSSSLPQVILQSPTATAPIVSSDVIALVRGGVLMHQSATALPTSFPSAWAPLLHQNAGGTCYGHVLCWGDQNMDLVADHSTIQTADPSMITYIAPSGTYVAGEQPGVTWVINGVTYTIKRTVQSGDTGLAFATGLGKCLGPGPDSTCQISPSTPTLTQALAAVGSVIAGPNGGVPAPLSSSDLRIAIDVPFGFSTCPTPISSASTTITVTSCNKLDNGPYYGMFRTVPGRPPQVGDQLGSIHFGGQSGGATGTDTSYAQISQSILSPDLNNPQGELVFSTASATSAKNVQEQLFLGAGVVLARANGTNCGYTGRGTFRVCGNTAIDGHLAILNTPPTITSGFGTSPTIAGADMAGRIVVGTGGASSGVITFSMAWAAAPPCIANNETTSQPVRATALTTTLTFTGTMAAGDKITWLCMAYQ
jgi:hypothetical protein